MPRMDVAWTKDQLSDTFKKFDKNGDNKLSREELQEAFKYLKSRWPYYRVRGALNQADDNDDGFIDLKNQELEKLVNFAKNCGYKVA
ncbi:hypothetical protein UlMin_035091 [Ulmus minor]